MITSRSTRDAANGIITFSFLWLSSIPLYVCICVCVYVCVYTTSSLSTYLLTDLGCFHVLAIVNSATMNTEVLMSFWIMIFLGYLHTLVGLMGHVVILFLTFKEISILFSIVAVSIYIPTNCVRVFSFLHNLSRISRI